MRRRSLCGFVILLFAASAAVAAPQHGSFLSNGVKIHYISEGEGEPVILIHGFAASAAMNWVMPGVFDNLARHYHLIALDNRGHGRSGKPHEIEKYGPEMAEDIVRLLDHLHIQKAHIVGYSMGGFITAKLVVSHPERIICAVIGGAGWNRAEDDHAIIEQIAKSLEAGTGITPLIKALTPSGVPTPSDEQLKTRNQLIMAANDPKALAACIRGMLNLELTQQQIEKNKVPVLAIVGEKDPLKVSVDHMTGVMGNLKVIILANGDHISTFQSPKFVEAVNKFLEEHSHHPATASVGK
ncbi:MAG TPA: alpha/beta hydrolase [Planctomycetaceae bacterium]|nr:alpha/beta hydrolase [Planctomycetaceae bacterium]